MKTYTLTEQAKTLILTQSGLRFMSERLSFDEKNMSDQEFFIYVNDLLLSIPN